MKFSIRAKVFALLGLVGLLLAGSGTFASRTLNRLAKDAETRDQARIQVSSLYKINLLVARELAGGSVRDQLDQCIADFESGLVKLGLGSADEAGKPQQEQSQSQLEWGLYIAGIQNCLGLAHESQESSRFVMLERAPLFAKISATERAMKSADQHALKAPAKALQDARSEFLELSNSLYKLLSLPNGDELAQTALALELRCDRRLEQLRALDEGSQAFELIKDPDSLSKMKDLVESGISYGARVKDLLHAKKALEVEVYDLPDKLDRAVAVLQFVGEQAAASSEASEASFRGLLSGLAIVSLGLILLTGLLFRDILRSLTEANRVAAGIASGDLGQTIERSRQDEIGSLFMAMDGMQTSMRKSLEEVELAHADEQKKSADLANLNERQEMQSIQLEDSLSGMKEMKKNRFPRPRRSKLP